MTAIAIDTVISIAHELFIEADEGAQGPYTLFVNNESNCGILALAPHAAHQPGTIRQFVKLLQATAEQIQRGTTLRGDPLVGGAREAERKA